MNAEQIRAKFLIDNAEFLLNEWSKVLKGKGKFSCESTIHLGRAIELLEKVLLAADDLKMQEAVTVDTVMTGVQKGKVSVREAKELLELIRTKQDIEELPKLIAAMDALRV